MWQVLFVAASIFAPVFSQPNFVLPEIEPYDSPIIKNVTWYYRAGQNDFGYLLYLQTSYNFEAWTVDPVIEKETVPRWATSGHFRDAAAALLGTDYGRVYFSAQEKTTLKQVIGVAFSEYFGSEYSTTNLPLVKDPTQDLLEPSISTDSDGTYLFYRGGSDNQIHVVQLTPEGTQVRGYLYLPTVLGPTEDWEGGRISKYFVRKHGDYYYFFYTGNDPCSEKAAIGVARSKTAYGPYEKHPTPLLSAKNFRNPQHLCLTHPQTYLDRFIIQGENGWPLIV